jgi:hypothetical protein
MVGNWSGPVVQINFAVGYTAPCSAARNAVAGQGFTLRLRLHHPKDLFQEAGLPITVPSVEIMASPLGADIYQIAKNCRTSVEMIEKFYAAHIKNMIDAAAVNVRRTAAPTVIERAAERRNPEGWRERKRPENPSKVGIPALFGRWTGRSDGPTG